MSSGQLLLGAFFLQAILRAFWQITVFRAGPQSVPDSQLLLLLAAAMYIAANVVFILAQYPAGSMPAVAVDFVLLCAWCAGLLVFFGYRSRVRQTLIAMFGTGALLQIITLPLIMLPELGTPLAVTMLALVMVLLWSTAVHGYILSLALEKSFGIGIALAVVYFLLSNGIVGPLLSPQDANLVNTD
jgi:hypothetical protein